MSFESINSQLGVGTAPVGWKSITNCELIILVGVTGVGKSTTVEALEAVGITFRLLPNRRTLTDQLIIRRIQQLEARPIEPVTDRTERFRYTAAYRERFPGGMAQALSDLVVLGDERLLFDGLRGENEVRYAAALLPNARFLVLDAPNSVRVQRLLGRNDVFDQVTVQSGVSSSKLRTLADLGTDVAPEMFSADEQAALVHLANSGSVSVDALHAKLKIVSAEYRNYDPAKTIAMLQSVAPDRTWLYDTSANRPEEIARDVLLRL